MTKLFKFNKYFAFVVGALFLAVAIPYSCPNAGNAQTHYGSNDFSPTAHAEHVSEIDCCSNDEHHEIQSVSNVVSNLKLSQGFNHLIIPIAINTASLSYNFLPFYKPGLRSSKSDTPFPLRC